jgi:RNA polymerase sigma factor (sigma-70 family)
MSAQAAIASERRISCVCAGSPVAALVHAAAAGDPIAWDAIVHRFGGLIRGLVRSFRLSDADANDVVQTTWLRLLRSIDRLDDPAALGAWLATTARRESLRLLQTQTRSVPTAEPILSDQADYSALEDDAAERERCRALRDAVDRLPARSRVLVEMLLTNPECSYEQVGAALDMPIGSIGPTRERSLARLRRDPRLLSAVRG